LVGRIADRGPHDAPHYALAEVTLLAPIDDQEVWAAGVTYERSRAAREHESEHAKDVYARVYSAERPEIFYKADARRTVGPNGQIRVRSDSRWTVPEPELALVLNAGLQIVGYTIGNDVSSRDIEGENPLYLPQAKLYIGCCALGPWIVPAESVADPYALDIACSIVRQGATVWTDRTSTGQLHRRLDELVSYLGRCNTFPSGAFLLTGTCLVPPDSLTLQPGDEVEIAISGLGMLRNSVAIV
jgi:2-dehydro-3-deoxy-D-arabinonate dehydratase